MWSRRPPGEVALRILETVFGEDGTEAAVSGGRSPVDRPGESAGPPAGPDGAVAVPVVARAPTDRTYPLPPFQEAAVARVRRTLDRRGGVVLADAVGLGKTYVALAVAEERLRAGGDVVTIVPAALRSVWSKPLRRIVRAGGRGERCRVLSHTQLSRGATVPRPDGGRLIIVDEAHRFRNPATLRYRALARLMDEGPRARASVGARAGDCRAGLADGAAHRPELLLVTATPVNNALVDLYHLIRLFLPDDGLQGAGVPSVQGVFETDPPDPAGLRLLARELVVRRSRPMVERRFGGIGAPPGDDEPAGTASGVSPRFPRRAPPRIHRYRDPATAARVAGIEALQLTAYGSGAGPLVRLSLLKRMDSSPAAFGASLRRLQGYLDAFTGAARAGRLLRPGDRTLPGDGDPLQLPLLGIVADRAAPDIDLDALVAAAAADRRTVEDLIRDLHGSGAKLDALVELLESLAGDRVLVFTEYRDTAASLWRALAGRFRVARIDGSGAWLGAHPAGRRTVVARFAPAANGRPQPPERERVDVLIATDVLAEGLNLQDARHVISYDLPWNPVRLLQRIGRIDRLGSPYDEVFPHLFVPAHGLDAVLGLTRRLRTKLHGISTALDEPQADDLLQGLAAGSTDRVERAIRAAEEAGQGDPWERLRTLWLKADPRDAPGSAAVEPTPDGPRVWAAFRTRPSPSPDGARSYGRSLLAAVVLLVDARPGRTASPDVRLLEVDAAGEARPLGSAGADVLVRALTAHDGDPGGNGGDSVATPRGLGPILAAVTRYETALAARGRAPTALSARDPAARLARRVRRLMADAGAGLSPDTVRDAERVLRALADPLAPSVAAAVARLLDSAADHGPAGGGPADRTPVDHNPVDGARASGPGDLVSAAAEVLRSHRTIQPESQEPIAPGSTPVRAVLVATPKPG